MSRNEPENSKSLSGITDLFDWLGQRQSDKKLLQPQTDGDSVPTFYTTSTGVFGESGAASFDDEETIGLEKEDAKDDVVSVNSGTMPPDARRALVSLLRQGVILAGQKAKLFDAICRYQAAVRNHLADVYLKLVLDERAGVAFVSGLDESEDTDEEAVSLITRRTLSLYDTLLLLVLRKHYQERESTGEQRIIIDIERVEANLSPFLPITNSSRSDRRKLTGALQKMVDKHILSSVRGSDDRFEITPIIRYVVNAAFLENMRAEYLRLAQEAGLSLESQGSSHNEVAVRRGGDE